MTQLGKPCDRGVLSLFFVYFCKTNGYVSYICIGQGPT
jgi:hypothetical protein